MNDWIKVLVCLIYFVAGIFCISKARKIQSYAVKSVERNPRWLKKITAQRWMQTAAYVWMVRIIGVFFIAMAVIVALALMQK